MYIPISALLVGAGAALQLARGSPVERVPTDSTTISTDTDTGIEGDTGAVLAPLYVPPAPAHELVNGSYIVMFREDILPSAFATHMGFVQSVSALASVPTNLNAHGLGGTSTTGTVKNAEVERVYDSEIAKGYAGTFDGGVLDLIRGRPEVRYVEQNRVVRPEGLQHNPPWGLARISHERLTPTHNHYVYPESSGAGVMVYVLDTGVYTQHAEFGGRATWGKTYFPAEGRVDADGHGTHVAGTLASAKYGVAKKALLTAVKVLGAHGGTTAIDIDALAWVLDDARALPGGIGGKGVVVNMSLGGGRSRAEDDAVERAVRAGLHVVVAAGNQGADACTRSPAAAPRAITVGATTRGDARRPSSNYGVCVDVFAPGSDVVSAGTTGKDATDTMSGTSMASPHVAGLVAHFLSIYPHKTFDPRLSTSAGRWQRVLATVGAYLPGVLAARLPLPLPLPVESLSEDAATVTPERMKQELLSLAWKDLLAGPLPPGTPNLLAYNNYAHAEP